MSAADECQFRFGLMTCQSPQADATETDRVRGSSTLPLTTSWELCHLDIYLVAGERMSREVAWNRGKT